MHFVTWAAIITVAAQGLLFFNFFWSLFRGERATDNPWDATTLEWVTATPPPHDNFGGKVPTVYRGAYEFGVPGAPEDFVLQTTPDETEPNEPSYEHAGESDNGHGGNGHR
jgi:cytochrome c oxidase subunit 1